MKHGSIFLVIFVILNLMSLNDMSAQTLTGSKGSSMIVDDKGVMRWSSNGEEVALFGVNYSVPFAHGYRAINYVGVSHEETIDRDVYHFARMGLDAYRIHVWDIEISDQEGNLVENDHLRLLDYLIMRLEERGIKIVLTTMRNADNVYPESNEVLGFGFSRKWPKYGNVAHHTPEAVAAQQRYVKGFLNHVNQYSGISYKSDPDILAFEINNEPHHKNNIEEVKDYLDKMTSAMRETGLNKPIFYNMSHNFGVTEAFLSADIQGGTFQWYPTGLNAGFTQKGNFLPNVDSYPIPFSDKPGFQNKARLIYEFSTADVTDSYLYPAMVRTFRQTGFQFITQFAYDALPLASVNSEYKTHHLNLAYTPSKGISLKIAGEVVRHVARNQSYGPYPDNTAFGPFRVSYPQNLSEMLTDKAFYYSNNTDSHPAQSRDLEHLAGVGSSPIVGYEGTGAYFLDRLETGVWRLEVMPDAIIVSDPFDDPNPEKAVSRIIWNLWPMNISLADLGPGFKYRGINDNNTLSGVSDNQAIQVYPGVYILTRSGISSARWTGKEKYGNICVGEFVAPPPERDLSYNVLHTPVQEATAGHPLAIRAEVVGPLKPEKVELYFSTNTNGEPRPAPTMKGFVPRILQMKRIKGYTYEAVVPDSLILPGGGIMYYVVVKNGTSHTTWPGKFNGKPGDWFFYSEVYWGSRFVDDRTPVLLMEAEEDFDHALPLSTTGRVMARKILTNGSSIGTKAIRINANLPENSLLFLREYIGEKLEGRKEDLSIFSRVIVRARALNKETKNLQFGFLTTDGYTYALPFILSPEWQDIRIPLTDLKQTGTALRLTYPQMMNDFFLPSRKIPFEKQKIPSKRDHSDMK
jgi:hypothetical protein